MSEPPPQKGFISSQLAAKKAGAVLLVAALAVMESTNKALIRTKYSAQWTIS